MQPSSREMQAQGMAASLNGIPHTSAAAAAAAAQIALPELQNGHDDFLDQMLSSLPSGWAEIGTPKSPWDTSDSPAARQRLFAGKSPEEGMQYPPYDESTLLANRLRQHRISGGGSPTGKPMMLPLTHQQMLLGAASGDSGLLPLPLTLDSGGPADSPNPTVGEGLYNGFGGPLQHTESANQRSFHHLQGATSMPGQSFGAAPPAAGVRQAPAAAASASAGGATGPPRQKVRARRGQATDPHSIAERLRRERIAERMKALQELVPNANKTDKASMLDEIIDYVKFLQLQVKVLSMSRLGGAAAVAPLVADMSSEGNGGAGRSGSNGGGAGDGLTVTEHQVAKLMEEDMGSAMQYLQGKGLCLMPISLASAISSATTCYPRPLSSSSSAGGRGLVPGIPAPPGDAPSSPGISALSVQSADVAKEGAAVAVSKA